MSDIHIPNVGPEEKIISPFLESSEGNYSTVIATPPMSNVDMDVVKIGNEVIMPMEFVSVGAGVSTAYQSVGDGMREEKFFVKSEDFSEDSEEDPLKMKSVNKNEEELEQKATTTEDTANYEDCIKCAICNNFSKTFSQQRCSLCVTCYRTLRKNSKREWLKKLYHYYETCTICLDTFIAMMFGTSNNDLDIIQHDCTCEHFYCCVHCNLIVDKKKYLINHLKYCGNNNNIPFVDDVSISDVVENVSEDSSVSLITKCKSSSNVSHKNDSAEISHDTSNLSSQVIEKDKSLILNTNEKYPSRSSKNYKCKYCKRLFKSSSKLTKHLLIHTRIRCFTCKICKKTFTESSKLKSHLMVHSGEKAYSCEVCKKSFKGPYELKSHLMVHSREKPYFCEVCKKRFKRSYELKSHLKIHSGEKPYSCDICEKSFAWSGHLKYHLKVHSGEKLTHLSFLKSHARIHSGEKHYSCEICKKTFKGSYELKSHLKVHSAEKPYSCDICKKTFKRSPELKSHLKVHSAEKPYWCEICKKSFKRSEGLKCHLKVHSSEKSYCCKVCKNHFLGQIL